MIRKLLPVLAALILLALGGCGEEPSSPLPPQPAKKAAPVSPNGPESEAAPEVAEPPKPRYVYDPIGRRDPFVVPLGVQKPVSRGGVVPLTPLQKFDLGQLRIIGVIIGKGESRAMVVAPDGKSYILKKDVKVGRNDGVVVGIDPGAVHVKERYFDFSGVVREKIQKIELPEREGV